MQFQVKATAGSGRRGRWAVSYFRWSGSFVPRAPVHAIEDEDWTRDAEGNFTATIDLDPGNYALQGDVVIGESKLSVSLTPEPPLLHPERQEWPLEVKRSNSSAHQATLRFFTVGDGQ